MMRRTLTWKAAVVGGAALGAGFGSIALAGADSSSTPPSSVELQEIDRQLSAPGAPLSVLPPAVADIGSTSAPSMGSPASAQSAQSMPSVDSPPSPDSPDSPPSPQSPPSPDSPPSADVAPAPAPEPLYDDSPASPDSPASVASPASVDSVDS